LSILAPSNKKPSYVTMSVYMLFCLRDKEQRFVDLRKKSMLFRVPSSSGCSNALSLIPLSLKMEEA